MSRIGIDVGGTNTDAVLLQDETVVAAIKTPTTPDVTGGIGAALHLVLQAAGAAAEAVDTVVIGTTHFTNAIARRKELVRVAAVRICFPTELALEPFADWPEDLAERARGAIFAVAGGHEYDGRAIVPFDEDGMRHVARAIRAAGLGTVAVTAVFSPVNQACEEWAAAILLDEYPEAEVTLSHRLGQIGLIERENAALLNACLRPLAKRTVRAFMRAMEESGLSAALFLTQNDGTIMSAEMAEVFPILCFASGPTNSMRGAAYLSGIKDGVVVDVGGTTTDIGMLRNGFPRQANEMIEIGGVRTLFRMPDLISLALGGGTLVYENPLRIGPDSVGYELARRGRVFGGDELVMTDLAVRRGLMALGDATRVSGLDGAMVAGVFGRVERVLQEGIDRVKTFAGAMPVIAVGGASALVPDRLDGVSQVIRIPRGEVANAIGAAIAQVSGQVDQVFQGRSRDEAIAEACRLAEARAIEAGAEPRTLSLVEIEDLPLAYLPGNALRVRARVVGDIGSGRLRPDRPDARA